MKVELKKYITKSYPVVRQGVIVDYMDHKFRLKHVLTNINHFQRFLKCL